MTRDENPNDALSPAVPMEDPEISRTRPLTGFWRAGMIVSALATLAMSIYMIFNLGIQTGFVPFETQFYYVMLAVLLPLVFIAYPALPRFRDRIPVWDMALALACFALFGWFALISRTIMDGGWEYVAPFHAKLAALAAWGLVLEATRRAGGMMLFAVCTIFSVYPVFGYLVPGFLNTPQNSWDFAATFHVFGTESIVGMPTSMFGTLIIGYLLFGVALAGTGGGKFFINFAFALLGHMRGGPAKVSVISSGMMGSLSGSVVTNVLTTGVLTIPAMKKVGFRRDYAAGVEACASTGGALMPPIMGAAAFLMAFVLNIPYSTVVVAAIIPSVLYYLALFVQIDAYAARHDLKGLDRAELPSLKEVLKQGWYFVAVLVVLVVFLLYFQLEARAPFYATALLLILNRINPEDRLDLKGLGDFIVNSGRLFAELAAVVAAVGMIIGSLTLTGKIGTLSYELVSFAGDDIVLLLVVGAVTCFLLGTGMTSGAAYIFLSVTLAPALVGTGLNVLAVHLFVVYWSMISFITPPVALGSFCAASVAGGSAWKTSIESMRLGSVIYIVPFFFVLNPALIAQAPLPEVLLALGLAIVGVGFIAMGMQGYFYGIGRLETRSPTHWVARLLLIAAGVLFAAPGGELMGVTQWELSLAAIVAAALAWLTMKLPVHQRVHAGE